VSTHAELEWTFHDTVAPGTPLPLLVVRAIGAVGSRADDFDDE